MAVSSFPLAVAKIGSTCKLNRLFRRPVSGSTAMPPHEIRIARGTTLSATPVILGPPMWRNDALSSRRAPRKDRPSDECMSSVLGGALRECELVKPVRKHGLWVTPS